MPEAPWVEPLSFASLDEVVAAIRAAGRRVSAVRRMVLEELLAAEEPASAESIAGRLRERGATVEPTSIYRNLERLETLGIVRHVHLGHGPGLYALIQTDEREYLVCERCGRVKSVHSSELDPVREAVRERFGYEARFSHFPIAGLCSSCIAAERSR